MRLKTKTVNGMLHNVVLVSNVSRDIGLCTQELGHFGAIHCHCIKRFMIEIVCNLNNALWW